MALLKAAGAPEHLARSDTAVVSLDPNAETVADAYMFTEITARLRPATRLADVYRIAVDAYEKAGMDRVTAAAIVEIGFRQAESFSEVTRESRIGERWDPAWALTYRDDRRRIDGFQLPTVPAPHNQVVVAPSRDVLAELPPHLINHITLSSEGAPVAYRNETGRWSLFTPHTIGGDVWQRSTRKVSAPGGPDVWFSVFVSEDTGVVTTMLRTPQGVASGGLSTEPRQVYRLNKKLIKGADLDALLGLSR